MPGTARRIPRRDRRGRAYEHHVPATIAELATIPRLADAETGVRALDELAATTPTTKPAVRSLLTVESLPGRQIRALAIGRRVTPGPDIDRMARRFEQACHRGARAPALDLALLRQAHGRIVAGGGTPRTRTSWIGDVESPADAAYVPPPATEIDRLLADLLAFLRRDDLCPVAQTMVGYAQLESVHPFVDGNGRLGRWLVQVALRRRGVVHTLAPPVGLYFATYPRAFTAAIHSYHDGDIDTWCTFAGEALQACAASARTLLTPTPTPTRAPSRR